VNQAIAGQAANDAEETKSPYNDKDYSNEIQEVTHE
jgi:hypothetical protein